MSEKNINCEKLKKEFLLSKFTCSTALMVPKGVLTFLNKEKKDEYSFAKYGEAYNSTDIPVYPNKRIIFNGVQNDLNLGFIFYERGGIAITRLLLIYQIQNKNIYVTHFNIINKYETIEELQKNVMSINPSCF